MDLLPKPIRVVESGNGIHTAIIERFEDFPVLLQSKYFGDRPEYIFRGHRDPSWPLLPTLQRKLVETGTFQQDQRPGEAELRAFSEITAEHLYRFLRGLRGTPWHEPEHDELVDWFDTQRPMPRTAQMRNLRRPPAPPHVWRNVLKLWSLGQHHGLDTPLLDWTENFLTAVYFAFAKTDGREVGEETRAIFALNRKLIASQQRWQTGDTAGVEVIRPFAKVNPRMGAQHGLFTISHSPLSIEDWVALEFEDSNKPVLLKILIRNDTTPLAMRSLHRAGISDLTMFPDLTGITTFCNRALEDEKLSYL